MSPRSSSNRLLAAVRLGLLIVASLVMFAVYKVWRLLVPEGERRITFIMGYSRAWYRVALWILGIRVRAQGSMPPRGAFIAPNHISYLDIIALGSVVPSYFVTRTEILRWPVIGYILRSFDQPAVERHQSHDLRALSDQIGHYLKEGRTLTVFLEGTTTSGDRVLPFRSSIVQGAINAGAPLAPVGMRWSSRDRRIDIAEDVAYWKDHEFGPHVWRLFGLRGLEVDIQFGELIPSTETDRKRLSVSARKSVLQLAGLGETEVPAKLEGGP